MAINNLARGRRTLSNGFSGSSQWICYRIRGFLGLLDPGLGVDPGRSQKGLSIRPVAISRWRAAWFVLGSMSKACYVGRVGYSGNFRTNRFCVDRWSTWLCNKLTRVGQRIVEARERRPVKSHTAKLRLRYRILTALNPLRWEPNPQRQWNRRWSLAAPRRALTLWLPGFRRANERQLFQPGKNQFFPSNWWYKQHRSRWGSIWVWLVCFYK